MIESHTHNVDMLVPCLIDSFRGERTGWDKMFVIPLTQTSRVNDKWLISYIKSPTELDAIEYNRGYKNRLLVCDQPLSTIDRKTANWIRRFEKVKNKNSSKSIQEACKAHKPFWWSLRPKQANIFTAINPYTRFFFAYSQTPVTLGQRLIGFTVTNSQEIELITALLNSAISLLTIEMKGVSRNLGVLDLNANFFKELRFPNPALLNERQKNDIIVAFSLITQRSIGDIFEEIHKNDRINFDLTVLRSFGINENLLNTVYQLLAEAIKNRISMKDKSVESSPDE